MPCSVLVVLLWKSWGRDTKMLSALISWRAFHVTVDRSLTSPITKWNSDSLSDKTFRRRSAVTLDHTTFRWQNSVCLHRKNVQTAELCFSGPWKHSDGGALSLCTMKMFRRRSYDTLNHKMIKIIKLWYSESWKTRDVRIMSLSFIHLSQILESPHSKSMMIK